MGVCVCVQQAGLSRRIFLLYEKQTKMMRSIFPDNWRNKRLIVLAKYTVSMTL